MKATENSKNQNKTHSKQLLPEAVCRPILFSTPMVQAILSGQKTMTRRILKVKGCKPFLPNNFWDFVRAAF